MNKKIISAFLIIIITTTLFSFIAVSNSVFAQKKTWTKAYRIDSGYDDTFTDTLHGNLPLQSVSEMGVHAGEHEIRTGFRWSLDINDNADVYIYSANLTTASSMSAGWGITKNFTFHFSVFDYDSCPDFSEDPLNWDTIEEKADWYIEGTTSAGNIEWDLNATYTTDDISLLVQAFVDRSGYSTGDYFGLVSDGVIEENPNYHVYFPWQYNETVSSDLYPELKITWSNTPYGELDLWFIKYILVFIAFVAIVSFAIYVKGGKRY